MTEAGATKSVAQDDPLVFRDSAPDGEWNRDIEIRATAKGLLLDDYTLIPWDWVNSAYTTLFRRTEVPPQSPRSLS